MSQPTAAEQHQNLVAQEKNLLEQKARLLEQTKTIDDALASIRSVLEGAQLGYAVAKQEAEAKSKEAPEAPAPDEE